MASAARPDPTQFDPGSPYFDVASRPEAPRWLLVDVQVLRKTRKLTLPELRADPALAGLRVLHKGNRLSITPVEPGHWRHMLQRLEAAPAHVCRTVARRAERTVVALDKEEAIKDAPRQYLNRLSDLMFVLARVLNRHRTDGATGDDVCWKSEHLARAGN
ncbi:MAG: EVE domain-containing protein [Hylemonella sp.]|nr:EVE domain-containing protein [Hylemonella sp.]